MRFKKYYFLVFLWILHFAMNAQDYATKLAGRVLSKDSDVSSIHVSNKTTNKGTITDDKGFFTISVKLNDTLVFSAVQFKQKELVVDLSILETELVTVILEAAITELNEVVVMPYNLSGALDRDMRKLKIGSIISASTEKLPNANLGPITQTERKIFTATDLDCNCTGSKLDPLFNYFSGRTKMLKKRLARDSQENLTNQVRKFYTNSLYVNDLNIPENKIDDFVYFSARDSSFNAIEGVKDKLKLWEFFQRKSRAYRKLNNLD